MIALVAFEGLAVVAALPEVTADLGQVRLIPWVVTGFLLTSGVATLVSGSLVDSVGSSVMFRWAVTIFTIGSLLSGIAPSMILLILARVVQGVGGGLIISVGLTGVALGYPDHLVSRAYAANATVWGVFGVAGPGIAALLLTFLGWRWVFLIILPFGAASMLVGWRALPARQPGAPDWKLDLRGIGLMILITWSVLLAVSNLSGWILLWIGVTALLFWLYRFLAVRTEHPVVKVEHMTKQPFVGLALGMGMMMGALVGVQAYLPLYLQGGTGVSAAAAAWAVLFVPVGWTIGANVGGRLADRMAETTLIISGFGFTVPAMAVAGWSVGTDYRWLLFAGMLVAAIGVGTSTNAALTLLRSVSRPTEIGRTSSAHQFLRIQGVSYGTALAGAVVLLIVSRQIGDPEAVRDLLAGELEVVPAGTDQALSDGFRLALFTNGVVALLGWFPVFRLRRYLATARMAKRGKPKRRIFQIPPHTS